MQRLAIVAVAIVLCWFGYDRLFGTLVGDLGINTVMSGAAALFVGVAAAVFGILTFGRLVPEAAAAEGLGARRRRFLRLLLLTLVCSGAAVAFVAWDGDNLDSWRFARQLEAGPDVSKRQRVVRGTHVAILEPAGAVSDRLRLASLTLPGHVQKAGGTLRIAARGDGAACVAGNTLRTKTAAGNATTIVTVLAELCAEWRVADLAVPAGNTELQLRLPDDAAGIDAAHIAVLDVTGKYDVAWSAILTLAIALPLACAIFVTFPAHEGDVVSRHPAALGRRKVVLRGGASLIVFLVVANLGVHAFVSEERTIYAWDFGGHWMSAVNVANALRPTADVAASPDERREQTAAADMTAKPSLRMLAGTPGPVATLLRSVRYAEYNPTAAIPVAIPMALTKPTRLAYELALVNVYGLAVVLVLTAGLAWVTRIESLRVPAWWAAIPAFVVLLFNPFWVPIARGYLGVSVVVADLLVLCLYFRRPITTHRAGDAVLIALLLAVSVLLRRWNAYFVVGFFVLMLADSLWHIARTKDLSGRSLLRVARTPVVAGGIALGVLAVIAWPVVVRMVTTDYADIYSAYAEDASGLAGHVAHFVRAFGVALIAFIAAAAVYLIKTQTARRIAVLLVLQLAIMLVHFSRTQAMGPHHLYLLMPATFILLGAATVHLLSRPERRVRLVAIGLLVLFAVNGVASHLAVFAPAGESLARSLVPILPDNRRLPLVRDDLSEFARLARYVDAELAALPADAKLYVLASSTVFSSALLRRLEVSTGSPFDSTERLLVTAAIDKRDGFPRGLIDAELVLVADPAQIHRRPEDQQVIEISAKMFLAGAGVGSAFERLPAEFELDQGVTVYAYLRTRPNSDAEIGQLSESLRTLYPDRPSVFRY